MSAKEETIRLLDRLSERDLEVVNRMLRGLVLAGEPDPVLAALANAPEDDEEETEEERRAVAESKAAWARGEFTTHAELMQRVRGRSE